MAGGSAEEKPPILMTFDSGEVLQRLAAGGEGGRVWGELDEAEKDRLRGQCLQGKWPLHAHGFLNTQRSPNKPSTR